MAAQARGKIDRSMVQELGGLELGDLERAGGTSRQTSTASRLERPVMQIRLDQIAGDSPIQSREKTFDPAAYAEDAELLASIREHGVLEPIMVARDSAAGTSPVYNIVFGHRRRAAAEMAGSETIPAIIARSSDDLDLLTLAENTGGRPLSSYERAVALVKIKEERPSLTQTALAKRLGTSQGTISNLLAAYEGSTPPLRGLFAEGMNARAVVELQETFAKLGEREQVELARQLRSASQQTVRSVKELIGAGVEPHAAAAVGMSRAPKHKAEPPTLDERQLRALAEQTGASLRSVRSLAGKARKVHAGLDALRMACVYVARGGRQRNPMGPACELAAERKVSQLVARQLQMDRKARTLMEGVADTKHQEFLRTVFFGGDDGPAR
jgi:ParB family chromosome partitioning protein